MSAVSPYDEALLIIRKHPGTSGAGGLAKLVLSLYNDQCGFSFAECVSSLDDHLTSVALRMVQDYARRGETEDLRSAGKILVDELYPGLWEMGQAMATAREETRKRWEREDLEREAAKIYAVEHQFTVNPELRAIPITSAEEMLSSEDSTTHAYYYSSFDWREKELSLEKVRAAIREHGTGFLNCNPSAGNMLGVLIDDRVYYVYADYDARERYLESIS
jgi:predicted NAD-dependent protein-ADP-ribosyltransferase YbiA (DUF1768 family)